MTQKMTNDRFRQVIDAYGAASHRWPADERQKMTDFLDIEPAASAYLEEALALDRLLDADTLPDYSHLTDHIVNTATNPGILDRLIDWLMPDARHWWRPAVAASIVLTLGMSIGMTTEFDLYEGTVDTWDEEISLLALEDNLEVL